MPTVAGLGNVGHEYCGTRHNVGFAVVRELANRWRLRWIDSGAAWTASRSFPDHTVVLVQPRLLMNRSGEALLELDVAHDACNLIVVHDEIDLPHGCVRVKVGGGTAGHRGVASIAAHYGSEFTRIRVGVGRPTPGADVAEYVLERFGSEEETVIAEAIRSAADAVECVLERGLQAAMQRFNTRQAEPEAPAQASVKG